MGPGRARSVPGVGYFHADGSDLAAVYDAALAASAWVRERRSPAFLHLAMVRFGGHAGSDVESGLPDPGRDRRRPGRRPAARHGPAAGDGGPADPGRVRARYEESRARILGLAAEVAESPRLATAAQVMAPLAPHHPEQVWAGAAWPRTAAPGRGLRRAAPRIGRAAHPGPVDQRDAG